MLEPSDLYASVNRLLVGIGQILTAAALLAIVAACGAHDGNIGARNGAVLALGLTTIGYALQLGRATRMIHLLVLAAVAASWGAGIAAVALLLFGGR